MLLPVVLLLSFVCGIKGYSSSLTDHVLDLHKTPFQDGCSGASRVVCRGSNITDLPADLSKEMKSLILFNTSIRVLRKEMFATFFGLEKLYIFSNRLSRIDDGAFNNLTDLKTMDLSFVYLNETELQKNAFQGLDHLELLQLSSNHLEEIPTTQLKSLIGLKKLHLINNNIKYIREGSLSFSDKLEEVDLTGNVLINLDTGICGNTTSLKNVKLSRNKLGGNQIAMAFAKCSMVELLDLSQNSITEIQQETFQDMTSLTKLVLTNNDLQ